jgi:hypothetical protein
VNRRALATEDFEAQLADFVERDTINQSGEAAVAPAVSCQRQSKSDQQAGGNRSFFLKPAGRSTDASPCPRQGKPAPMATGKR